ncbi:MAG: hypothetical protein R2706_12220 [Acidimicrobiales bacterium]
MALVLTSMTSCVLAAAVMGSSTAYWLTENPDFDGRVLVVESGCLVRVGDDHASTEQYS